MRGEPGGGAKWCLVTVCLALGGVTSPAGTEAVKEHPEELELAVRRELYPGQAGVPLGLHLKPPTAHYSTCSRCGLRIPEVKTTQNLWSCRWW